MELTTIVFHAMTLLATAIGGILWYKLVQTDKDIKELFNNVAVIKQEMGQLRLNYLDRFQDLKDHSSSLNLQLIQRIAILETKLSEFSDIVWKTLIKDNKQ